jgi:5-methylcytosine-specific restriction endonuclease McrA
MSQHHKRMSGGARQKRNRKVFATKGDVCHICGHPGSDAIDHVLPLAPVQGDPDELARRDNDLDNLRPAHHDVACETCGERCNRTKGDKPWAPIIRRSSSLDRP